MNCHILPFAKPGARIIPMFWDESLFGRITKISHCWCEKGVRPIVKSQKVREYTYVFGAFDPFGGESCFIFAPACNTAWTSAFLEVLSKQFADDYILLIGDQASHHKSKDLKIPENIRLAFIPPRTPEMNPSEGIWDEIKEKHFANRYFETMSGVLDELSYAVENLARKTVMSITQRDWIFASF